MRSLPLFRAKQWSAIPSVCDCPKRSYLLGFPVGIHLSGDKNRGTGDQDRDNYTAGVLFRQDEKFFRLFPITT
jgi:hypothetical protein